MSTKSDEVTGWSQPIPPITIAALSGLGVLLCVELFLVRTDGVEKGLNALTRAVLASFPYRTLLALSTLGTVLVLTWPHLAGALRRFGGRRLPWIGAHVAMVIVLFGARWMAVKSAQLPSFSWWFATFLIAASASCFTWCSAVLPLRGWSYWWSHSRRLVLIGILIGAAVWGLASSMWTLASVLQPPTLATVNWMLETIGRTVTFDPTASIIGTAKFRVEVGYACSGIQGIGLIWGVLCVYLWLDRRALRFPHVFLLVPLATIAMFVLNAIRITTLILIGEVREDIALLGFHSAASWLYLSAVALGIVVVARSTRIFSRFAPPPTSPSSQEAVFFLLPLFAFIGAGLLTQTFSADFELIYPVRPLIVFAVLWCFRKQLAQLEWSWNWSAILIGIGVFALWVVTEPSTDVTKTAAIDAGLQSMTKDARVAWLSFRALGSIAAAPLAEELAFRGYLYRRAISSDWRAVDGRRFRWFAFVLSSLAFGALHGRWIAGTFAGGVFAYAQLRRGRLCDAITAHAIANALVTARVLVTGDWSFWS